MATIVCQGLQSCLESQVVESRTLRLKLSSPKLPLYSQKSLELALKPCPNSSESNINDRNENPNPNPNPDNGGGWSFLQDLSNSATNNNDNVYIHPLMKRYSSKLSEKSLELCTESLGCETGSDISSENAFLFESSSSSSELESESESELESEQVIEKYNYTVVREEKIPRRSSNAARSFPPPLTTMSGAGSLQFKPRREGGRLIITAVEVPEIRSCFEAERSEGRLRLTIVNDCASNIDFDDENDAVEEEAENENENENDAVEVVEEEGNNYYPDEGSEIEERDMEGNNLKVGGEIGKKDFQIQRRKYRRCTEGEIENRGLLNWEHFWVATT
ncbi:hypothetical protein M5689_005720 [Euphorbia peplus]|nr:hypothetical protein M5689_005720 [Euphorbia peplus]